MARKRGNAASKQQARLMVLKLRLLRKSWQWRVPPWMLASTRVLAVRHAFADPVEGGCGGLPSRDRRGNERLLDRSSRRPQTTSTQKLEGGGISRWERCNPRCETSRDGRDFCGNVGILFHGHSGCAKLHRDSRFAWKE